VCWVLCTSAFHKNNVLAFLPTRGLVSWEAHHAPSTSSRGFWLSTSSNEEKSSRKQVRERVLREFINLEPLAENDKRERRLREIDRIRSQFVSYGNDLWDLRNRLNRLTHKLRQGTLGDGTCVSEKEQGRLKSELLRLKKKDAELVHVMELSKATKAYREGRNQDARVHMAKATEARSCLPQLNLEGLWYGAYSKDDNGGGGQVAELINVTYVGNTLIATKVRGNDITFQADLHPLRFHSNDDDDDDGDAKDSLSTTMSDKKNKKRESESHMLEPIALGERAAKKFGTRLLTRYKGLGCRETANKKEQPWTDGQLVIVSQDYFGFVWSERPKQQKVMFARPSDELVLQLLSSRPTSKDDIPTQTRYITRCLEQQQVSEKDGGDCNDGYDCISGETDHGHFE